MSGVMAGLDPAIPVREAAPHRTEITGSSPVVTRFGSFQAYSHAAIA